MSNTEFIDIVLSADERYAPYAAVVMASALDHAHEPSRFRFHMLTTGISEGVQAGLKAVVSAYKAQIVFSVVSRCELENLASGRFGAAALLRLYMQDYLPADCKRVIYLDCDVLVMEDLAVLWEVPLEQHVMAAAMDLCRGSVGRQRRDFTSYFNSGVMLIDLMAWRDEQVADRAVEYLKTHQGSPFPDQDALNHVLEGRWKRLEVQWNFQPTAYAAVEKRYAHLAAYHEEMKRAVAFPCVVHFIGGVKPWHPESTHPLAAEFIRYSAQTPWPINARELRKQLPWKKRLRLWLKRPKQLCRKRLTRNI